MNSVNVVESIIDKLSQSVYDPQSETKHIRENIDVKLDMRRRHVTVTLINRDLFDTVLILIDKNGYAGPDSRVSAVKKLTREEYTKSFNLNDDRYVTARVGDVYVPILFVE